MFADFVTLAADQLINFAAKFGSMYGDEVRCPLTVRLPSGGGRGYGPTHSQSLEYLFTGIPGIRVVAVSHRHCGDRLLQHVVHTREILESLVLHHEVLHQLVFGWGFLCWILRLYPRGQWTGWGN